MILSALSDYYEILAKAGEVSKPGYCKAKVSYALNLTQEGKLASVIPLKIERRKGKKTIEIPQLLEVPEQGKKTSGISANFLCENSSYVLGVDNKGKPERSQKCFESFKELHHKILDELDCVEAKAVLTFLDTWNPDIIDGCAQIADFLSELTSGVNMVFMIGGAGYAHDSEPIRKAWESYISKSSGAAEMQCLVTGKVGPVARLHPSIKGVRGSQSTGASIVSFNARSFESYGRDEQQGLNAPVNEYVTFAYTTVLNHLLSDNGNKQFFGDTTVVYWAKSPKKIYNNLFEFALEPKKVEEEQMSIDEKAEWLIESTFKKIVEGKPVADLTGGFDPDTKFYILGLSPNASRLSVRFFMQDSFGNILENIAKHYRDLEIYRHPNDFEFLPLWKLLSETVSPKSRDRAASPLLSGVVLQSIFSGRPYPAAFYNSVMIRIRAERDISRGKAAIIKAYLIRSNNKYKEELTVSLNEQSKNKAYILGRLFAVLEKAQQDANPGITATIKDRYFTSACSTPASVFPILLKLSNHHTSKAKDYGYVSEKRKSELLDKLNVDQDPFPAHLSLEEQGIFILGYYHQQKSLYTKKDKEDQ